VQKLGWIEDPLFLSPTTPGFFLLHPEVTYLVLRSRYDYSILFLSYVYFPGLHVIFSSGTQLIRRSLSSKATKGENVKPVSDHVPTHLKPQTDEEFGHYLAGLIDGVGSFGEKALVIAFHGLDASLAYYIKGRLGYGSVKKINDKKAVILSVTNREGLDKVINLINGKLRVQFKLDSLEKNILYIYKEPLNLNHKLNLNTSSDLSNHWLAGFIDAGGSFQIQLLSRVNPNDSSRVEIQLYVQIDQKTRLLLDLIKDSFGGNIGHSKSQDTFSYNSTSFGSAKNFINYLDHYHLLSSKHVNYLKWRKAYRLVQSQQHLTLEGQMKIKKLKSSMISYSD
jgi:hypothetical protein